MSSRVLPLRLSYYLLPVWGVKSETLSARRIDLQRHVWARNPAGAVGELGMFCNSELIIILILFFLIWAGNFTDLNPGTSLSWPGPSCVSLSWVLLWHIASPFGGVKTDTYHRV